MENPVSVTQMIHQLRSDDPRERDEAARLVWEHYFRDLLALAQRQLSWKIRRKVDAEDLLQSVYASVCRRQQRGDFDLYDRDDFWKLLLTVTLNKARNAAKWHQRARRDVGREVSLDSAEGETGRRGARRSRPRACLPTKSSPWPRDWSDGSAPSPIPCSSRSP